MSILKNLFSPKWVQWRVVHSESEAHDIQSVFEQNGIRYKLSAYTKESRTLSSAHQFTNNRTPAAAMNSVYMSDSGLETYTFEVHRDDIQTASKLISSGISQPELRDTGKEFNMFGWKKFYHCTDRQQADRICEILTKENIRYKVKIPEDVGRNFATAAVTSGMSFSNPASRTVNDSFKNSAGSFTFKVHKKDIERARKLDIFRELSSKPAKPEPQNYAAQSRGNYLTDAKRTQTKAKKSGGIISLILIMAVVVIILGLLVPIPQSVSFTKDGVIYDSTAENPSVRNGKIVVEGTIYNYLLRPNIFKGEIVVRQNSKIAGGANIKLRVSKKGGCTVFSYHNFHNLYVPTVYGDPSYSRLTTYCFSEDWSEAVVLLPQAGEAPSPNVSDGYRIFAAAADSFSEASAIAQNTEDALGLSLDELWKKTLLNLFVDIVDIETGPGSQA